MSYAAGIDWEEVYREESPSLWRALVLHTGSADIASDAVAEAFAQGIARGDGIRKPGAWVWKAAFMIVRGELAEPKARAAVAPSEPPKAAWRLLDPWYRHEMGWQSVGSFASSDAGSPRTNMERMDVSKEAGSFSRVSPTNSSFLFARMGAGGCNAADRDALTKSLWYVSYVPHGGNAPGYLVVLATTSGFRVVHVD